MRPSEQASIQYVWCLYKNREIGTHTHTHTRRTPCSLMGRGQGDETEADCRRLPANLPPLGDRHGTHSPSQPSARPSPADNLISDVGLQDSETLSSVVEGGYLSLSKLTHPSAYFASLLPVLAGTATGKMETGVSSGKCESSARCGLELLTEKLLEKSP